MRCIPDTHRYHVELQGSLARIFDRTAQSWGTFDRHTGDHVRGGLRLEPDTVCDLALAAALQAKMLRD